MGGEVKIDITVWLLQWNNS